MTAPDTPRFVEIDVSKAHLDVALLPEATTFRVPNDDTGWATLIARIAGPTPPTVVLEATGSHHVGVTLALAAAGMPPAVMNPAQTHAVIRSEGQRTKTERIDARLLARFGQQKQPSPSPVLTQNARDLKELVACRDDFTKLLTMEQNRIQVATDRTRHHHQAMIDHLTAERRAIEREIAQLIAADAALTERDRIVQSTPGVGPVLGPDLVKDPEVGFALGIQLIQPFQGFDRHEGGNRKSSLGNQDTQFPIVYAVEQLAQLRTRLGKLHFLGRDRCLRHDRPLPIARTCSSLTMFYHSIPLIQNPIP